MKLFVDKGNVLAGKILIAGHFSTAALEVIEVKGADNVIPYLVKQRLPVLQMSDGNHIFSANAAARYVYGDDDKQSLHVEEWLEWEATQLLPVVHALLVSKQQSSKADSGLEAKLRSLLDNVEGTAKNNPEYLTGESLSLADIVIWTALYPAFCSESPLKELRPSFPNISKWFDGLQRHKGFLDSLQRIPGGISIMDILTSLAGQPLVALPGTGNVRSTASKVNPSASVTSSETESVPSVTQEELKAAAEAWNYPPEKLVRPREIIHPILPNAGEKNFLITSALPYVNNVPHLGNIIGCVLSADVFARFCRLRNHNVLYVCGTDEYGTATETKAMEEGLTPQQICDKYNKLHTEIYQWFNIGFDYFGRTTTQQQTDIAQDIFWKLHKNGYILKDSIDQLQCVKCNRFLADRFVEGTCPFCAYEDARGDQCDKCGKLINAIELVAPRCKQCGTTPIVRTSEHLFMDLPKLQPLLVKHLDKAFEEGIWSSNTKVITKSWIRDGLKPRCISRDLKWGTPVPLEGYTDKVFYVWYDAPIGYVSITANYTDQWEKWWKDADNVELYQFMAKDNVPFHSVIFPSSQLGTGDNWTVVKHLSATEYLNYEDGKFSKSRGVGVFGDDAQHTGIPADVWRFYLLFLRPESQDSAFSWEDFMTKNNSELLNNLGNFINRALMFVSNTFGGVIPAVVLTEEETELLALVTRELTTYVQNLEKNKLRDGIRNILSISRLGNQYMQSKQPWVLVKGNPDEKGRGGTVVGLAANMACLLSVMLQPYMPEVSATIQAQLAAPPSVNILRDFFVCALPEGHQIGHPKPLFQKLDAKLMEDLQKKFVGKQGAREESPSKKARGKGSAAPAPAPGGPKASQAEIDRLTAAVAQQGEVVRQLKSEKADKAKITSEVNTLLDLKRQLATAQGTNSTASPSGGGKKAKNANQQTASAAPAADKPTDTSTSSDAAEVQRLTDAVAKQGDVVRQMKGAKADKADIDGAVSTLLELKRFLAVAQGITPDQAVGGGKKKKGKK